MKRTEAQDLDVLIRRLLKGTALEKGILLVHIGEAFAVVTGMGEYVLDKYYDKGVFYCRISSSIVRQELNSRKVSIIEGMNKCLRQEVVKDIVFR